MDPTIVMDHLELESNSSKVSAVNLTRQKSEHFPFLIVDKQAHHLYTYLFDRQQRLFLVDDRGYLIFDNGSTCMDYCLHVIWIQS